MKSNKIDIFKKCLFLAFIIFAITIVISIVLKYNVEGENTLPYSIEKILIVSQIDTHNNEDPENLWDISLDEYNDVYIYIKKSEEDTPNTIKSITMNNFTINQTPKVGQLILYRPTGDFDNLYEHSEQDYLNSEIKYEGAKVDTLKTLEIGNAGGMMGFRVALNNLGTYISNNYDEEVTYDGNLLTKSNIALDDLKFNMSFDIKITLDNDVNFLGNLNLNFPSGDVINEKQPFIEITDFSNIVFKREK